MGDAAAARWRRTWALAGAEPPPGLLADLVARHAERHRHYHVLAHVLACLAEAAACRPLPRRPAEVDLALWFHDAVYDPRRPDNEERSAALAARALGALVPAEAGERIGAMILDTRHRRPPSSPDGAVVADADLAILGAAPDAFDAYQAAIRREYAWVPWPLYRRRRAELLRALAARPRLYATDWFHDLYEARAHANLRRALTGL